MNYQALNGVNNYEYFQVNNSAVRFMSYRKFTLDINVPEGPDKESYKDCAELLTGNYLYCN
jgi:hypothetical protein